MSLVTTTISLFDSFNPLYHAMHNGERLNKPYLNMVFDREGAHDDGRGPYFRVAGAPCVT